MSILTNDLLTSFDTSTTDYATAVTLPPEIYTSEEFLATARNAAGRRGHKPGEDEIKALRELWESTAAERRAESPSGVRRTGT